jgi:ribosome biogenesis protein BMS1
MSFAISVGPIAPPTTGVLAVQSVAGATVSNGLIYICEFCYTFKVNNVMTTSYNILYFQSDFRISATGTVLALDKTVELVKKLKLTGTPFKIYKNTAFVKVRQGNCGQGTPS